MQVNLLRFCLPEGSRVDTVDRFQGQEATVLLISMATSYGDDLPRQIEFLYSRNRLNVANLSGMMPRRHCGFAEALEDIMLDYRSDAAGSMRSAGQRISLTARGASI
jgi:hypothetical protein